MAATSAQDASPLSPDGVTLIESTAAGIDMEKSSPIPDRFIQCPYLCCAFTLCNCDFPSCWGCKGNCQFLCVEEMGFCCKFISHERACCVWFSDACEIVSCASFCKCYRQCCCFEFICGCPLEDAFVNTEVLFGRIPNPYSSSSNEDTRPFAACCCEISSCFLSFPSCCSAYIKSSCCCLEAEGSCCKSWCCANEKYKQRLCCTVQQLNLLCISPSTLCKGWAQLFCLDSRCALPCDNEVPCIFMPLPCVTACVNFGFKCHICGTMAEIMTPAPTSV